MIIPSKLIPNYFHKLKFPIDILAEKGGDIALGAVSRTDLLGLIEADVIIAIGSWCRIKHIRLCRPVEATTSLRLRVLNGPPTVASYEYTEDLGNTHQLPMLKRPAANGEYKKWDQNLTFEECRRGRIESETTAAARRERQLFRRIQSAQPVGA